MFLRKSGSEMFSILRCGHGYSLVLHVVVGTILETTGVNKDELILQTHV